MKFSFAPMKFSSTDKFRTERNRFKSFPIDFQSLALAQWFPINFQWFEPRINFHSFDFLHWPQPQPGRANEFHRINFNWSIHWPKPQPGPGQWIFPISNWRLRNPLAPLGWAAPEQLSPFLLHRPIPIIGRAITSANSWNDGLILESLVSSQRS